MQTRKMGLIYALNRRGGWSHSHTHKPTLLDLNNDKLRIYFGVRNKDKRTTTTYIDVLKDDPRKIIYEHDKPCLGLGKLGTFDDAGANVSCAIRKEEKIFLYYIGWNTSTTVPSRNSIGLAVSEDGGVTFSRYADGPIMDRTPMEPYYTVAPYVLPVNNEYYMWYTSGTHWEIVDGRPEIHYHIKFAKSKDGINWDRPNVSCILPNADDEVTARPCVVYEDGKYKMWYSYRSVKDFRVDVSRSYRIGYAESPDGINWTRLDHLFKLELSDSGWDSQMTAYPALYTHDEKKYLIYNGNDFGKDGFGYALIEE